MVKNAHNILKRIKGIRWIPFILLLFVGCRGCCPVEEWTVVSNTHGEIQKIILCYFSPGHPFRPFYDGVVEKFAAHKIEAIDYTLPADERVIRAFHLRNASLPKDFDSVLKLRMSREDYTSLKLAFKNLIDFKKFSDGSSIKISIPDSLKPLFEEEVSQRVAKKIKLEFDSIIPNNAIRPEIIVSVDFDGDYFRYNAETTGDGDDEIDEEANFTWWVQDACHARQKFCRNSQVDILYSNKKTIHKNTAIKIKQRLPYITINEKDYHNFDGGNIIPSANYVLVGRDIFHDNRSTYPEETLITQLSDAFNIEHIIPTGMVRGAEIPGSRDERTRYQPIFHIDMFLTPAGKKGDKNLIFTGHIYEELYTTRLNETQKLIIQNVNAFIDSTIINLERYQRAHSSTLPPFEFEPLPLFIKFGNEAEGSTNRIAGFSSFNNAIIEIMSTSKKVYLPNYTESFANFIRAKQLVKQKFMDAGYNEDKIIFINPPADELGDGALHCYTKVLWREKHIE